MIGSHVLKAVLRNGSAAGRKLMNQQGMEIIIPSCGLSSMKTAWPGQQRLSGPPLFDMKLVSRRYSVDHGKGGYEQSSHNGTPFASKLIAAAGTALVGLGSASLFHVFADNDNLLTVSCAEDCFDKDCNSDCLRKRDCEEEIISKANAELEKVLKDVKPKAMEYTEAAMKAYCEAIAAMKDYMNQGYNNIDADCMESPAYEEAWCCVYQKSVKRYEKVKDALQKGQCAWVLLCRLREVINSGKACKYTSCNPLLVTAEETLLCAEKELLNLKARMDCANSDHCMVQQYKCTIQDFRKDLRSDIKSICLADDCKIKFPEQETALMIRQAYLRAVRAQTEMAKVVVCEGRVPCRLQPTLC